VVLELKTRRIENFAVTCYATNEWIIQQLREAAPQVSDPNYLLRDKDRKYRSHFSVVAASECVNELKTPNRALRSNGVYERFMASLRRECLIAYIDLLTYHWHGGSKAMILSGMSDCLFLGYCVDIRISR
jgi:putative transposase